MKHKPYPKYKDSGVEWLGEVPEEWEVRKLKWAYKGIKSGDGISPDDIEPIGTFPVFGGNGIMGYAENFNVIGEDIIIGRVGAKCGNVYLVFGKKWVSDNALILNIGQVDKKYLAHVLIARNLNQLANQNAQPLITGSMVGNQYVPLPHFSEQQAIAGYLDRKTAKIDALIDKKQDLVKRLQEKRSALISHAVTKGINPKVKMKPSGVEWLGEVPEGWGVWKIGHLAIKIGSGKTPNGGADVYQEEGILFIRSQNVYDNGLRLEDAVFIDNEIDSGMAWSRVQPLDVLLNITGASLGRTCIVPDSVLPANVNQHVCIIRMRNKEYAEYVSWYLKSKLAKNFFDNVQNGSAREGLNFKQISDISTPLPPFPEQQAITAFLEQETSKFDMLIDKVEEAIKKLKEYRSALISAAVTGKIDVRDFL